MARIIHKVSFGGPEFPVMPGRTDPRWVQIQINAPRRHREHLIDQAVRDRTTLPYRRVIPWLVENYPDDDWLECVIANIRARFKELAA